jgi:hypothetical protein
MSGYQKQPRKITYPRGVCPGWTGEVDLEEYREEFVDQLPHLEQFFDEISKLVGVYAAKLKRWKHDPAPGVLEESIDRKIEQTCDLLHELEAIAPKVVQRIPNLISNLNKLKTELERERRSIEPEIRRGPRTIEPNVWFEDRIIYIVHQANGYSRDVAKVLKMASEAIPHADNGRTDDAYRKRAEKAWKRMASRGFAM